MIKVTKAIGVKLRSLYPNAIIYTEQQESGFKQPAFFLQKINTNTAPLTFRDEMRSYGYQLVYFPDPKRINGDIEDVEATLLDWFDKIVGFAQITDREFMVQDKCLLLTFNVRVFTNYVDDIDKLQKLNQKGGINHG